MHESWKRAAYRSGVTPKTGEDARDFVGIFGIGSGDSRQLGISNFRKSCDLSIASVIFLFDRGNIQIMMSGGGVPHKTRLSNSSRHSTRL